MYSTMATKQLQRHIAGMRLLHKVAGPTTPFLGASKARKENRRRDEIIPERKAHGNPPKRRAGYLTLDGGYRL